MDINALRKDYAGLDFSQKKEYILNLKKKVETANSVPLRQFLEECITEYNSEVRARNEKAGFAPKPKLPDITPDTFAKALITMISGGTKSGADSLVRMKLIGKWQREPDEGDYYYKFNEDGSFETNEFEGAKGTSDVLRGNFSVGIDNVVLMEPHEKLKFESLMFSQTGDSLIIGLKDGLTFEYNRV
ncbi:MAG: hypothetical protein FWC89_06085 [Defluviitaleaceae bacterium]|nr:hypothetical protein [Defluviitaleaceae bacterium]